LLSSRQLGESLFARGEETRAALKKSVIALDESLHSLVGGDSGLLKKIGGHHARSLSL
jgi:hypothetical protein